MQPLRYLKSFSPLHPFAGMVVFVGMTATIISCTPQSNSPPTAQNSPQVTPPEVTQPITEAPTQTQAKETQTGSAAFISEELEGQKTANGETYDQTQLVAAHASYPMGTVVRVTNPENQRTVEVRVIDRIAPPQSSDQPIIDLSLAAAQQLGFTEKGITKVQTEVITKGNESSSQ
jgi:rare lipoprotein A